MCCHPTNDLPPMCGTPPSTTFLAQLAENVKRMHTELHLAIGQPTETSQRAELPALVGLFCFHQLLVAAASKAGVDKKGYAAVFDVLLDTPGLLSANACLVFDNTLWKGRVAEGTTGMSPSEEEAILADAESNGDDPKRALKAARRDRAVAQALHEFNVKLRKDVRVDPLVLPLRDGLTVAIVS